MKLQVYGSYGMLGSAVVRAAEKAGHAVERSPSNLEMVTAWHIKAPVVINCAGLVKQRQEKGSTFMLVNAYGPHRLAEACDAAGARLIHISTDCVFQGPGPHAEWDAVDCEDEYSLSKLAGEISRRPHVTIRTSFVGWGPRGLLADLARGGQVRASGRMLWSGHTVNTIAGVLLDLAERSGVFGLLHVPGAFQSRWDLCQRIVKRYGLPAQLIRDDDYEADRRLISTYWMLPALPSFDAQLEAMERPS